MLLLFLAAVAGWVTVEGSTTCPSALEVGRRLEPLLGSAARRESKRAALSLVDGALLIELRSAAGTVVATRQLQISASCEDLATAAAVVIASWEERPAPSPEVVQDEPPDGRTLDYSIGAAIAASFAGGIAPGLVLDGDVGPRGGRWAGRLAVFGMGPREQSAAEGVAQWSRLGVGIGPRVQFPYGRLRWKLHGEAIAALLRATGRGFSVDLTSYNFDPGLAAGAELALRIGPVSPFLGIGGIAWLRAQQIEITGVATPTVLPRFEVLLTLGVRLGGRP